jgi:hypothetical protein
MFASQTSNNNLSVKLLYPSLEKKDNNIGNKIYNFLVFNDKISFPACYLVV